MKFLRQILLIFLFSFLGELLRSLIPLPIPASIYGMVLLFAALCAGLVKTEQVREAGGFLTSILPLLFVGPTVGLAQQWELIAPELLPIVLLIVASTVLTFGISGAVAQRLGRKGERDD